MNLSAHLPETPRVLAPYVRIGVQAQTLFLGFGSIRQAVSNRQLWKPLVQLAHHHTTPRTRSEALAFLTRSRGVDGPIIAVWGPLVVPGVTGCWDCRTLTARPPADDPELSALITGVNGRYQAPSNGPVNMLASSLAALDVLRHLGGFGQPASLNRRMGVWTHDLTLDEQAAERDPGCPTCADVQPTVNRPRGVR